MRLLLVEDEAALAEQLVQSLTRQGYAVDHAADGEEGWFLGDTEPYDAVLLDLGLPKLDGVSVLKRWRAAGRTMPVLVLTARDSWHDKVQGLDAGADDYLAKPFRLEELLARLRALIRRTHGQTTAELVCGPVRLDTSAARVTVDGAPVALTAHEFKVLSYLMHRKGQVVPRSDLVEHVYAQDFDRDSNTIEVFVGRLRKKLGDGLIRTVRGLGYQIDEPADGGA